MIVVRRLVNVYRRLLFFDGFVGENCDFQALLRVVVVRDECGVGFQANVVRARLLILIRGRVIVLHCSFRAIRNAVTVVMRLLIRHHPLVGLRRASINGGRFRFVLNRVVSVRVGLFNLLGVRTRGDAGTRVVKYFHFSLFVRTSFAMNP